MQKRTDNFSKFANQKKGSALKEAFRQEKKKNKIEARAAGEEMRQRKKDKMRGLVTEPLKKSTKPGARKGAPSDRDERAPRAGAARPSESSTRPTGSARPITPAKTSRSKDTQAAPVAGMPAPIALKTAEQMPLNKFIAHAGVCGRREAAELVKGGKVVVNGDKIFEPGFTTKKRGWGLGLSLTKRIVEEYHDGRIKVLNSEVNKGTTFQISFRKVK